MKFLFFSWILLLFLCGCADRPSSQTIHKHTYDEAAAGRAFSQADSAANEGETWAFLKLYEIANDDYKYGAEYSEVAQTSLTELFYYKTGQWIDAFSSLPDSNQNIFKTEYSWAYIGDVDFAHDSTVTQERYRKTILDNLSKIRDKSRKQKLAEYFTHSFRSAIISDQNKSTK